MYRDHLIDTAQELLAADLPLPVDLVTELIAQGINPEELS